MNDSEIVISDVDSRVNLITRNLEEVIGAEELPGLLTQDMQLRHYIGLEISGKLHLGTGIVCMKKIRDLQQAGIRCTIFLADWHTWINDKLGGNRDAIRTMANGYFKKLLMASLAAVGGKPDDLDFVLGTDLYHHNDDYWAQFVEVCKNTTLARIERSISIMGRKEGESKDFAKLLYPPMQVADIFMLRANIAHGGIDQRKAHVIARDVADSLTINPLRDSKGKVIKPVIVHHHMLLGLEKPPTWPVDPAQMREMRTAMKMSKSRPNSAVFIHDTPDEIRKKIRKAFCPPGEVAFNPVLDWAEHIVFDHDKAFHIKRTPENGGDMTILSIEELENVFASGKLHPTDLKVAVAQSIIDLLEPIRKRFSDDDLQSDWDSLQKYL